MTLEIDAFGKKLIFAAMILTVTCLLIAGCSPKMNGERTVYGRIPLAKNTVEAERICDSMKLPEASVLLETRIYSKQDSGVVTKVYSTNHHCLAVDQFFSGSLIENDWTWLTREVREGFFESGDTRNTYSSDGFNISVDCGEMKDFRGVRRFYVSCHRSNVLAAPFSMSIISSDLKAKFLAFHKACNGYYGEI